MPTASSICDIGFDLPVEIQLLDGERELIFGRIRRVNTGFFQLHSPKRLEEDLRVKVVYEGRPIEGEVVYCQKLDIGGYHVGVRMTAGHLGTIRKELRLPVRVGAMVSIPGEKAPMRATVVDMSQSGLGLMLPKAIAIGMSALVDLGHGVAFGEIRYCQKISSRRFRAGVLVEEFLYRAPGQRSRTQMNQTSGLERLLLACRRFGSLCIGRVPD